LNRGRSASQRDVERAAKVLAPLATPPRGLTRSWLRAVRLSTAVIPISTHSFVEQATELDAKRRGAILERIQQLMHEKAIFAPIWEIGDLHGVGPRVEDPVIGYIAGYPFSAPYEDVKLKAK
jgi:hypothetical protein